MADGKSSDPPRPVEAVKWAGHYEPVTPEEHAVLRLMRQYPTAFQTMHNAHAADGQAVEVFIVVQAFVTDPKALGKYSFARFEACGGEARDFRKHAGDPAWQLLNALLFSNENPPPDDYGVKLGLCVAEVMQ